MCLFFIPTPSQNRQLHEGKVSVPNSTRSGTSWSLINAHPVTRVLGEETPPALSFAAFPYVSKAVPDKQEGPPEYLVTE